MNKRKVNKATCCSGARVITISQSHAHIYHESNSSSLHARSSTNTRLVLASTEPQKIPSFGITQEVPPRGVRKGGPRPVGAEGIGKLGIQEQPCNRTHASGIQVPEIFRRRHVGRMQLYRALHAGPCAAACLLRAKDALSPSPPQQGSPPQGGLPRSVLPRLGVKWKVRTCGRPKPISCAT